MNYNNQIYSWDNGNNLMWFRDPNSPSDRIGPTGPIGHTGLTGATGTGTGHNYIKRIHCDGEIIRNLDFTVHLRRESDNCVSVVNFSAIWGTDDYENIDYLFNTFLDVRYVERTVEWENCMYFVDNLTNNE